jgi:Na+-translocating ferredoxin:NAD+ oxidoreductase subunit C
MKSATFSGGIHPPERKEGASGRKTVIVPRPAEIVIPVNQHFGPPLTPIVSVGDHVVRGQKIAEGEGPMAVPVHASLSGTVRKIEPRVQSNAAEGLCVIIETDVDQGQHAFLTKYDPFNISREEALVRIRECGIVGMGGAAFPTAVKLDPPAGKKIGLVIANGAECEPYLCADESSMEENAEKIVVGLALAIRVSGASAGIIAIEDNKKRLAPALERAVVDHGRGADIAVRVLKTKYPQGGEKMLIATLTGREVPSGGLPADVGCIVQNVGTLIAITDAMVEGRPLIDRPLTVSGGAVRQPENVIAPIGTSAAHLTATVVRLSQEPRKIVFGGPMMGVAVPNDSVPVQKNTSGILFLSAAEADPPAREEGPCIRCGKCMRSCSCRLSPTLLNAALEARDFARAEKIGLMDCVECGSCAYVCPSRIRLAQRFRSGKQVLRLIKQREAAHAR